MPPFQKKLSDSLPYLAKNDMLSAGPTAGPTARFYLSPGLPLSLVGLPKDVFCLNSYLIAVRSPSEGQARKVRDGHVSGVLNHDNLSCSVGSGKGRCLNHGQGGERGMFVKINFT